LRERRRRLADPVLGPIVKGLRIAASPQGRRAIKATAAFARSEQGRAVFAQAKSVATSPTARKLAAQAAHAAKQIGETAKDADNRRRIKSAATYVRQHARRP
jgi:hypothetical protein